MKPESMSDILRTLKRHKVPLQHSVTLLCKVQGRAISDLAHACEYHRNSLYKALAGEVVEVQPDMIEAVAAELGVNPWAYSPGLPKKTRRK